MVLYGATHSELLDRDVDQLPDFFNARNQPGKKTWSNSSWWIADRSEAFAGRKAKITRHSS